jgi:transcriptional regulator with XRE-family HTH domain
MNNYTAAQLRQKRMELGLTQDEMAKRLGVSRSVYSQRECGACNITDKFARRLEKLEQNCSKQTQPSNNSVEKLEQLDDPGALVVAPVEVLTTVEENNKLLTGIDDTISGLDNTLTEVAKSLKVLEGFDAAVQRRVREVIEERSQHIIAMCNLHVTSQSQIIIAALTAVITVLEAGNAQPSVAITLLERLRDQIARLPKVTRDNI